MEIYGNFISEKERKKRIQGQHKDSYIMATDKRIYSTRPLRGFQNKAKLS